MNLRSLARRGVATAALLAATLPAAAAVFSFSGSTDSGPLPGSPFSGQFSFADPDAGFDGSVPLDGFTLLAFGQTYSLADADFPAAAIFAGGVFTGVDFFDQDSTDIDTQPNVSLMAGFFDPLDASFSYEAANGRGFGSITFAAASVPEPATLAAVLAGLALLGGSRRRQPARG
jgi:hypothetical protein